MPIGGSLPGDGADYSSTAAILSSTLSNLRKLVVERSSLLGIGRVRDNFGQLEQIKLDLLRSCAAPRS